MYRNVPLPFLLMLKRCSLSLCHSLQPPFLIRIWKDTKTGTIYIYGMSVVRCPTAVLAACVHSYVGLTTHIPHNLGLLPHKQGYGLAPHDISAAVVHRQWPDAEVHCSPCGPIHSSSHPSTLVVSSLFALSRSEHPMTGTKGLSR